MKKLKGICREIGVALVTISIVIGIIDLETITMAQSVIMLTTGIVLWFIGLLMAD